MKNYSFSELFYKLYHSSNKDVASLKSIVDTRKIVMAAKSATTLLRATNAQYCFSHFSQNDLK